MEIRPARVRSNFPTFMLRICTCDMGAEYPGPENSKSTRGKPKLSVENCSDTLGYQGRQTGRKTGRKRQSIYHPTPAGFYLRTGGYAAGKSSRLQGLPTGGGGSLREEVEKLND